MQKVELIPPCAYQGGKQRLNKQILDIIDEREGTDYKLYDLCCGSGAVSLEAISRDRTVVMIDKGCYGAVWEGISNNKFDLNIFQQEIEKLPKVEYIQEYLTNLSKHPVNEELMIYHYLLLQAGAFGSKQIWITDNKWCNNTFRSYWLPTETSNRKSPVNPMMPLAVSLLKRVETLVKELPGKCVGYQKDVFEAIELLKNETQKVVVYIDPPYVGTTGYKERFDILDLISELKQLGVPIYVSEGLKIEGSIESWRLSESRKKGNISGGKTKNPIEEWLNYFI